MRDKKKVKGCLCGLLLTGVGATFLLTGSALNAADDPNKPNFLFIQSDQFRYDLMRFVQDSMPRYSGKTKIRTPNLDRLRSGGVYFSQAYTQCAVCGPSRATFRTGCTVERHGEQSNDLCDEEVYTRGSLFKNKIEAAVSFEMILVGNKGYLAEHYGKWHMPEIFNWSESGSTRIMTYNDYDFVNNLPKFNNTDSSLDYDKRLGEIAGS
ncbi:MAG: sulfatase-like hydrolase/transferase, partial [Pontiellaceae bacterium]|nr:sulfatase-like hydrolase/transferase [Pontiellaceae bacterium]